MAGWHALQPQRRARPQHTRTTVGKHYAFQTVRRLSDRAVCGSSRSTMRRLLLLALLAGLQVRRLDTSSMFNAFSAF